MRMSLDPRLVSRYFRRHTLFRTSAHCRTMSICFVRSAANAQCLYSRACMGLTTRPLKRRCNPMNLSCVASRSCLSQLLTKKLNGFTCWGFAVFVSIPLRVPRACGLSMPGVLQTGSRNLAGICSFMQIFGKVLTWKMNWRSYPSPS